MTVTVRLSDKLKSKLDAISELEGKTRSEIIKESLDLYFSKYNADKTPFELGKDLFGKYQSGFRERSINARKEVQLKIKAKYSEKKSD